MHVVAECRLDFLTDVAQMIQPAQPHLDNPRLQLAAQEAALTPAQRAALLPHWHSFLNESLRLRQELRATLAAISSNPAALGLSLGGAGSSQAAAQVSARLALAPHTPNCAPAAVLLLLHLNSSNQAAPCCRRSRRPASPPPTSPPRSTTSTTRSCGCPRGCTWPS